MWWNLVHLVCVKSGEVTLPSIRHITDLLVIHKQVLLGTFVFFFFFPLCFHFRSVTLLFCFVFRNRVFETIVLEAVLETHGKPPASRVLGLKASANNARPVTLLKWDCNLPTTFCFPSFCVCILAALHTEVVGSSDRHSYLETSSSVFINCRSGLLSNTGTESFQTCLAFFFVLFLGSGTGGYCFLFVCWETGP